MSSGAGAFEVAAASVGVADEGARAEATALQDCLAKPQGSLGRLEEASTRLAAIAGRCPPPVPDPAVVAVFAGDHGVWAEGISPWPQEVTGRIVAKSLSGGAAINVLARHVGARLVVVDVGVASEIDAEEAAGLISRRIRAGTGNLAVEPAMSLDEACLALDIGAGVAADAVAGGARCLVTGEMGICNTTPSAALIAAFTGKAAREVTGRGTGIDDDTWLRKVAVVERALERAAIGGRDSTAADPVHVLAEVGGFEIAALAGFIVGGAAARVPVIVDGVVALAAALAASAMVPHALDFLVAGHRSVEPGASAALSHLGLEPLLDLGMRLGEGTGACLALPLLQASAKVMSEMATFDAAGVSKKA